MRERQGDAVAVLRSAPREPYLWHELLPRESVTNVLNYAQVVAAKDEKPGRKKRTRIWPHYHQLDVVRRLLADAAAHGVGRCYLIQHLAGSGKSNSIAWLAHQLIGLVKKHRPANVPRVIRLHLVREEALAV